MCACACVLIHALESVCIFVNVSVFYANVSVGIVSRLSVCLCAH